MSSGGYSGGMSQGPTEPHVKKRGYTVKTVVYEKHFDAKIMERAA